MPRKSAPKPPPRPKVSPPRKPRPAAKRKASAPPRSKPKARRPAPATPKESFKAPPPPKTLPAGEPEGAFPLEIDPTRVEETLKRFREELTHWAKKGRYTKVRFKLRGKPLLPDLPLVAVLAAEGLTFYWGGILRALIFNLAGKAVFDVELVNDSEKRVMAAREALLAGDADKALALFREALEMERDSPNAHLNLGIGLKLRGDLPAAQQALERARALDPLGDDLYELRRVAEQVRGVMQAVEGVVDLAVEQQADLPFLTIKFDRPAIARHGLRIQQVAEAVETAFGGQVVSRVLEGQAAFDLVARYEPSVLEDLEVLRATLIATPGGARIPLHALADIQKDRGPNTISREDVQRKLVVMANVAGRDLGSVVEDIRARVSDTVSVPSGYRIEYGGQFESAEQASRTILFLGMLVVLGIFLILFLAFRSARDAALVMVNLPLALIGGVVGVFLAGSVMSVASLIGFITLFGIATRNGIMVISHIHITSWRRRVSPIPRRRSVAAPWSGSRPS